MKGDCRWGHRVGASARAQKIAGAARRAVGAGGEAKHGNRSVHGAFSTTCVSGAGLKEWSGGRRTGAAPVWRRGARAAPSTDCEKNQQARHENSGSRIQDCSPAGGRASWEGIGGWIDAGKGPRAGASPPPPRRRGGEQARGAAAAPAGSAGNAAARASQQQPGREPRGAPLRLLIISGPAPAPPRHRPPAHHRWWSSRWCSWTHHPLPAPAPAHRQSRRRIQAAGRRRRSAPERAPPPAPWSKQRWAGRTGR